MFQGKECPEGRALMYFEETYPVACEQDGAIIKGRCPHTHPVCLPSKEHDHKVCCDTRSYYPYSDGQEFPLFVVIEE